MKEFFYALADELFTRLRANEVLLCSFIAEESDFVRFNKNRVCQAGSVRQAELFLDLIDGQHHASGRINVCCSLSHDFDIALEQVKTLRQQLTLLNSDPYLCYNTKIQNTESIAESHLPESSQAIQDCVKASSELDMVGFFASGPLYRGFANSLGQRNWYSKASFNYDWSCYLASNTAIKSCYSGYHWCLDDLTHRVDYIRKELTVLAKPAITLRSGKYRVYLAPAAVMEILMTLAWGGFGLRSHRTKQTPLIKLAQHTESLHPTIHLTENNQDGLTPNFTSKGFLKPKQVPLIVKGQYKNCLIDARSAKEYEQPINANSEYPQSLDLAAGRMSQTEILTKLNTGLYINNLWYSNYSDRNDCRITGITRYACFWVENGHLKAPINVMRFDESIYHMLGKNLLDITQEREFFFDTNTYERRSVNSMRAPGLLIDEFTFTL